MLWGRFLSLLLLRGGAAAALLRCRGGFGQLTAPFAGSVLVAFPGYCDTDGRWQAGSMTILRRSGSDVRHLQQGFDHITVFQTRKPAFQLPSPTNKSCPWPKTLAEPADCRIFRRQGPGESFSFDSTALPDAEPSKRFEKVLALDATGKYPVDTSRVCGNKKSVRGSLLRRVGADAPD